jgi:RND family efflux transporter MFP subunit
LHSADQTLMDAAAPARQPVAPKNDHMVPDASRRDRAAVLPEYSAGTGRRLSLVAAAIAIALTGAFLVVQHLKARHEAVLASEATAAADAAPPVEVIKVSSAPTGQALTLPGETEGWYSSTIYARVSGYVASLSADIGDSVKKNQVLATIDTPDLDAKLDAAKAQLKASEAEINVRQADADFAKDTYERWQGSPKGVVSEQEREDKRAQYAVALARLNAAQAKVNLDQANVNRLTYLTYLTQFKKVTAPYDGVITSRRVDMGDLVTAGSTASNTPLYGIAQSERIRVFTDVPQSAAADLSAGSPARVTTTDQHGREFEGKIARTSESLDPQSRTMRVEVDLTNPDRALIPGMYVQVQFQLKPTSFVQIPASALLFRAGGPQVAVIGKDDRVRFQEVVIGRDNGNVVEIASGIAPGETVALNIGNQIADGERVAVRDQNG